MSREVAVEHVVGDVDSSVGEPAGEGRILVIQDGLGEIEPLDLSSLFFPEFFSVFRRTSPSEGFFVRVLCHTIKINMAP